MLQDSSFLYNQKMDYTFSNCNQDKKFHEKPDENIFQSRCEWVRKCIIIDGIWNIKHILLILVANNKPHSIPVKGQDIFQSYNSSFAVFKDISIRALREITEGDRETSIISNALPLKLNNYAIETFFTKAEYEPVSNKRLIRIKLVKVEDKDITFVTQLTVDRLDRIFLIAERYGGINIGNSQLN